MRKEVDYISQYKKDMLKFEELGKKPLTKWEWEIFDLTMELIAATESQYERQKNQKKWKQLVEVHYPVLCEIAKTQGGHVILDIDEEALFGELIYTGYFLALNDEPGIGLSEFLSVMEASDDMFLSVKDDSFELEFMFNLYDKIKKEDHSVQIAKARQKLKKYQKQSTFIRLYSG